MSAPHFQQMNNRAQMKQSLKVRMLYFLRRKGTVIFLVTYLTLVLSFFCWMYSAQWQRKYIKIRWGSYKGKSSQNQYECLENSSISGEPRFAEYNNNVFILSAFVDNRLHNITSFRILGINNNAKPGYCLVKDPKSQQLHVAHVSIKYIAEDNSMFRTTVATCEFPVTFPVIPCYLYLSRKKTFEGSLKLPILNGYRVSPSYTYGICVAVLAEIVPINTLVEFVEFYKIVGGEQQHIYVYYYTGDKAKDNINPNMEVVLQYYAANGDISLVRWRLPVSKQQVYRHAASLAMQHCLCLNMWKAKFVLFPNIHQYLVPHSSPYWDEVFQPLHITHGLDRALCFKNYYFTPVAGNALLTMASTERTSEPTGDLWCLIPSQQAVVIKDAGISPTIADSMVTVDSNVAKVNTYLYCKLSDTNCRAVTRDDTMMKFKPELEKAFKLSMSELFELFSVINDNDE